jgi:hypothetical protein
MRIVAAMTTGINLDYHRSKLGFRLEERMTNLLGNLMTLAS